jgi:hypothetical protein
MKRKYLGDYVYAEFDGYHIWLITSDGIEDTNKIALEPQVLSTLKRYVDRVANGDEDEG